MTREKTKERLERAKDALTRAREDVEKYGKELEEIDKNSFWRTAKKYRITEEELKEMIAEKRKENKELIEKAGKGEAIIRPANILKEA